MSRHCDFCGKSEHDVKKLVEGVEQPLDRNQAYKAHICGDCAELAIAAITGGKP